MGLYVWEKAIRVRKYFELVHKSAKGSSGREPLGGKYHSDTGRIGDRILDFFKQLNNQKGHRG